MIMTTGTPSLYLSESGMSSSQVRLRVSFIHRVALVFWAIATLGLFDARPHNPFSVPGFLELAIILSAPYALFALQRYKNLQLHLVLFLTPCFFSYYSAIRANWIYDQSVVLGLIEERRLFAIWFYFPLVFHAKSLRQLVKTLLWVGFLIVSLGLAYRFGFISGLKQIEISVRDGRFGRANFSGKQMIILSLFALGQAYTKDIVGKIVSRRFALLFFLASFSFIILTTQTRQLALNLGIVTSIFFMIGSGGAKSAFFFGALALTLFVILIFGSADVSNQTGGASFSDFLDFEGFRQSARYGTILSIIEYGRFWGHGSLSGVSDYTFQDMFGSNFFLSDVGIIGTFFRYGFLGFIAVGITLYFMSKVIGSLKGISSISATPLRLSIISLFMFWAGAGLLEYGGQILALLLALTIKLSAEYQGQNKETL